MNQDHENTNEAGGERKHTVNEFTAKLHEFSSIGKVIGVVSGKGGVGKSLIASMLAVTMKRRGFKVAVLDADITGPSIPRIFGIENKLVPDELGIFPARSKTGIEIMSINLLLKNETDPVVWRGPLIANTVKQFWSDVIWGDIDYMFIDLPPGTGDAPLTVFQSIAVDGIIIVASPQELVSMIVSKAVRMAEMMHIPILGLIENMAYFKCPDCGSTHRLFGDGISDVAEKNGLEVLASLPFDPKLAAACDRGMIELYDGSWLEKTADRLEAMKETEAEE